MTKNKLIVPTVEVVAGIGGWHEVRHEGKLIRRFLSATSARAFKAGFDEFVESAGQPRVASAVKIAAQRGHNKHTAFVLGLQFASRQNYKHQAVLAEKELTKSAWGLAGVV